MQRQQARRGVERTWRRVVDVPLVHPHPRCVWSESSRRKVQHGGRRIDGVEGPAWMGHGERLRLETSASAYHQDPGILRCVLVDEDRGHAVNVAVGRDEAFDSVGVAIGDGWIIKCVQRLRHDAMITAAM